MIFALCDCNNFFVSCERLFRPDRCSANPLANFDALACIASTQLREEAL